MTKSPRKLIVHAGMHKTGSTAIQHWLHNTKQPDVQYFKWRNPNHSDLFVLLFEENPQDYLEFSRTGYTREQAMKERADETVRIRRQIERSSRDVFMFSAERISTAPDEAVRAMHDFFSEFFSDIQVYAYVRKPSSFMSSMFQQHLKTGRIKLGFAALWPNYCKRLGRLFKIFGRENVHLRSYDHLTESHTEIVGDFAAWTGLSMVPPSNIVLNWSMSATGLAFLYYYRKLVEPDLSASDRARTERHVLYAAQTIPGEPFHIELECPDRNRRMVARDLRWISNRMKSDIDDLDAVRDGVRIFANEDDILRYAVATSHHLLPWKNLPALDPDAPGSSAATQERFGAFLSRSSKFRTDIRRGVNWATGRRNRARA